MTMSRSLTALLALSLLVAGASAAVSWNSTTVAIEGTVTGRPESVDFSGRVQIQSRLSLDPEDSSRSKIILQIDLSGVSGVGASTADVYVVEAQEIVFRSLAPSDVIQLTFPFHPGSARAVGSSRTGVASFALDIDTVTGEVKAARAKIGSPAF